MTFARVPAPRIVKTSESRRNASYHSLELVWVFSCAICTALDEGFIYHTPFH